MKVFIIGATGFIGGTIAEVLQRAGHHVIGLARSEIAAEKLRKRGIQVYRGDLNEPATLLRAAKEVDTVIQAANIDTTPEYTIQNLRAVAKTLMENASGSTKTLIFTTGSNVYGGSGDEPVSETVQPEPGPVHDYERLILDDPTAGIRTIIIRPPLVYGRGGGTRSVHTFLQAAMQAGVSYYVGNGDTRISTIHVEDLADLYLIALEGAPNKSVFNAAGNPISLKEFAEAISYAVGLKGHTKSLPAASESNCIWPRASWSLTRQHLDSTKATTLLGLRATRPSIASELRSGSYDAAVERMRQLM